MNGNGRTVRNREAGEHPRPEDRRVRRTRRALIQALVALTMEKRYGAITIQDLLDRADVGRSTFYAHYRGKDDLLLRSFERMLEMFDGCVDRDAGGSRRIAPVRELFSHVREARTFHRSLASARMLERLYEAGINQMARSIERRMAGLARDVAGVTLPPQIAARAAAGALFAMLRWWLDESAPETPEQMDDMFHALLLPAGGGTPQLSAAYSFERA